MSDLAELYRIVVTGENPLTQRVTKLEVNVSMIMKVGYAIVIGLLLNLGASVLHLVVH